MKYANFDWDDNILYMPTNIIYFKKSSNIEVKVSTKEFAETRTKVGLVSEAVELENNIIDLFDYEIRQDESFREFRDNPYNDYFWNDMLEALCTAKFAPSFEDFIEACSTQEGAAATTIITARGHDPWTIYWSLKMMKKFGWIEYYPSLDNIFPVSCKKLQVEAVVSAANPSEAKLNVLLSTLDKAQEQAVKTGIKAQWGFSEDDKKTFDIVRQKLSEEILKNRWTNVEISVYFTKEEKVRHKL